MGEVRRDLNGEASEAPYCAACLFVDILAQRVADEGIDPRYRRLLARYPS